MTTNSKCLIGLRIAIAYYLYSYNGGVCATLTTKPRDVVAEKGRNVSFDFSTDRYPPDFYRTWPNSSTEVGKAILSNGGLVASTEDYSVSTTNGYYEITILHVTPEDAGTYVATDHDGFENAKKSSAELTIIDGPPNIMKGKNFVSWNFPHWGNSNITVTCVNAHNVTVLDEIIYGGRNLPEAVSVWCMANVNEVTQCTTVILPSAGCEQCDEYVYRYSTSRIPATADDNEEPCGNVTSVVQMTTVTVVDTRATGSTTDSSPQANGSNLSGGDIAGIVIAVVVFVVGIPVVAFCIIRRCRRPRQRRRRPLAGAGGNAPAEGGPNVQLVPAAPQADR